MFEEVRVPVFRLPVQLSSPHNLHQHSQQQVPWWGLPIGLGVLGLGTRFGGSRGYGFLTMGC